MRNKKATIQHTQYTIHTHDTISIPGTESPALHTSTSMGPSASSPACLTDANCVHVVHIMYTYSHGIYATRILYIYYTYYTIIHIIHIIHYYTYCTFIHVLILCASLQCIVGYIGLVVVLTTHPRCPTYHSLNTCCGFVTSPGAPNTRRVGSSCPRAVANSCREATAAVTLSLLRLQTVTSAPRATASLAISRPMPSVFGGSGGLLSPSVIHTTSIYTCASCHEYMFAV